MTSTDSNDALALNGPVLDAQQPITASPSSTLLNPPAADTEPESTTANAITRLDDDDGDESEDDDDEEEEDNDDDDVDDDVDASVKAPVPSAGERAKELERIVSHEMDGYKHPSSASEEEDEEDEEDSEEDSEEDDEEDEEPLFKYKRLEGSVPTVLSRRESASAITVANKRLALGTHSGIVHVMDLSGTIIKSFKPHTATIMDICMDSTGDFVATASMDGQVVIHSVSTAESYVFDMKRPMRTVALEPDFARRNGPRAFVCGGQAGSLVMHEKGWLGHKETILHSGEGPVYAVRWRARLVAWANDLGVKIYDTESASRITFIERPQGSPRADLFKCTLLWQDDATLLIGWADHIKVARVRARTRPAANLPPLVVETTADYLLDCMIAGIVPHPTLNAPLAAAATPASATSTAIPAPALTSLLVLAYTPPGNVAADDDAPSDTIRQKRQAAPPPELRLVSRTYNELSRDVLPFPGADAYGCNDYALVAVDEDDADAPGGVAGGPSGRCYVVLSPKDLIVVRSRDRKDHIKWLVERERFEEALDEVERMKKEDERRGHGHGQAHAPKPGDAGEDADADVNVAQIGQRYIEHLCAEHNFAKAAHLCPKVCGTDARAWEDRIFAFAAQHQLHAIIPYVPTASPKLDHLVYEVILADLSKNDLETLTSTLDRWPKDIYDIPVVLIAVQSELDRRNAGAATASSAADKAVLRACLADLFLANRQPGKALPLFLALRRPGVFDLIRDNNLFSDVQDQVLQLVEFDHELMGKRKEKGEEVDDTKGVAIKLLVDHIHSIPIHRVVQQLQPQPYYLFLYLDALFKQDPYVVLDFADYQVQLYAKFAPQRLIDFLRASDYYSLEKAYAVCKEADLVPEMVYLLGRMGGTNNKQALTLIIERLGDVHRAIDFAKEQADDDLWEDLLRYAETRPPFIRGLLETVGPEIDPVRLIRRISNGLAIPGLKPALLQILHDFGLQRALLEGCGAVLAGDAAALARRLQADQSAGFALAPKSRCPLCSNPLVRVHQGLVLLYLCRHMVHASCVDEEALEGCQPDPVMASLDVGEGSYARALGNKIALAAVVRSKVSGGCPVCAKKAEGARS